MRNLDYQKICSDLIFNLSKREKEVILRRFGLGEREKETLQSIGDDFGICRERVRQIQEAAFKKIKSKLKNYQKIFQLFFKYFKKFGDLRKEDTLLAELGKEKWKNEVYFLLSLDKRFQRFNQTRDLYSLWMINSDSFSKAKKIIQTLYQKFQKDGNLLRLEELKSQFSVKKEVLISYLEISKKIQKNEEGLYGLRDWPEINPRGIKDKAYLVFKKLKKPLHFSEVASLIEGANLQTVHNELIRDPRFVLVGRGTYALSEWGYYPGQVKDVILTILKEEGKPLTKEEVLEKVKKQRIVKANTVFLNLSNKEYFQRDSQGRYRPKTALI